MKVLIAESEVELIPKKIISYIERKVGNIPRTIWVTQGILDSNYHHRYMKNLKDGERRGRPDILYLTLHVLLSSRAFRTNKLEVYFSVRDGRIFRVKEDTRIPRSYNRFCGIMRNLLEGKKNPRIEEVKEIVGADRIIIMDENGDTNLEDVKLREKDLVIIGGFPRGGFRKRYNEDLKVKIESEPMEAWAVAGEILCKINL